MNRSAAELAVGEAGRVGAVSGAGDVSRRLLEMGITPGAQIRRLGAAPLGDPLEFELRGYRLSLRRAEARFVALEEVSK
jgi:ferrous iron transport protein A